MLQCSNTRLAFAALLLMLPVGKVGKAPRCGHTRAPGENQRDALVTALCFSKSSPLQVNRLYSEMVRGDSEPSDTVIVRVPAGVLCHARGYRSASSLALNSFPGSAGNDGRA